MDRFKIFLIRFQKVLLVVCFIFLLTTFYSFFLPEEIRYDIWIVISEITKSISEKVIPSGWNLLALYFICVLIPLLLTYMISAYLFPLRPWKLLSKIGEKNENTAKLCYSLLDNRLNQIWNDFNILGEGILVPQSTANEIQEKVLPIMGTSYSMRKRGNVNWYATSLLDPDDLWNDVNHKFSIKKTIYNAKKREKRLTRFIVTSHFEKLSEDLKNPNTSIYKIAKLHKDHGQELYLVQSFHLNGCCDASGVKKEYLDFLLIENELVVGLKNSFIIDGGVYKYETITKNENYIVYVRDTKRDLQNYKKLVDDLLYISDCKNQ